MGTDSGFAVTPYGEWHARELEYYVKYLGFSPAEAIVCATRNNSEFLRDRGDVGVLEPGRKADILVVKESPLSDISILQNRDNFVSIMMDGEPVDLKINDDISTHVLENSYNMWSEVYTQERVKEIYGDNLDISAAA